MLMKDWWFVWDHREWSRKWPLEYPCLSPRRLISLRLGERILRNSIKISPESLFRMCRRCLLRMRFPPHLVSWLWDCWAHCGCVYLIPTSGSWTWNCPLPLSRRNHPGKDCYLSVSPSKKEQDSPLYPSLVSVLFRHTVFYRKRSPVCF